VRSLSIKRVVLSETRLSIESNRRMPRHLGWQIDFDWKLRNIYDRLFLLLLIVSAILRVVWLDQPMGEYELDSQKVYGSSLIFDEAYYVNVARILLGLPHNPKVYGGAPLFEDPNKEHPPLGKLMIALSMKVLGDNAWGWRLPSLIFGIASIFIFYLLMKRMSRNAKFSLLASFLYSFDNLISVHSRIAVLDIFVLTFMLLGFYWYFGNRMGLAATSMGLSTLCKIGGFYGFLTVAVYHFLRDIYRGKQKEKQKIRWYDKLGWLERFTIMYGLAVFIPLFLLDRLFCGYENPIDHLIFIAQYTTGLIRPYPVDIESYPWQWLLNEVKIPYLSSGIQYKVGERVVGEKTTVLFLGAMNPLIIYLCLPVMGYAAYKYWKKGGAISLFILVWFACTYLPFYPLSIIVRRIMYLFYFLNTLPAVCTAIAYMLVDRKVPRFIIILYAVGVVAAFCTLFPFKTIP